MKYIYLMVLLSASGAAFFLWVTPHVPNPAPLQGVINPQPLQNLRFPLNDGQQRALQSNKVQAIVEKSRRSTEDLHQYHASRFSEDSIRKSLEVWMKAHEPGYQTLFAKWNLSGQESQEVLETIRRRRYADSLRRDKHLSGLISGADSDRYAQETLDLYWLEMRALLGEDRISEIEQIENQTQLEAGKEAARRLELIRSMRK